MKISLSNRNLNILHSSILLVVICCTCLVAGSFRSNQSAQELTVNTPDLISTVQSGELDLTFNGNGKIITDLGSGEDEAKAVAVQTDGKIVTVGSALNGGLPRIVVTRYSSTGVPEAGFGGFYPNGNNPEFGNAVAIQSDGKIIVAGGGGLARIFRLGANGQIDLTFADTFADEINAIAIQPDGKFVFAGYSRDTLGSDPNRKILTIFRYTTAGLRDATFGTNGRVRFSMNTANTSDDVATSVKIDSNGNIVVGGYNFNSGGLTTTCAFVRLLAANGGFDNTFDGDGRRLISIGSDGFGGNGRVNSIALTTDNKITAAISNTTSFTVARLNTDGTFDTSFDGNGMATANFGVPATAKSPAIQPDGRIVVGASTSNGFGLATFNANGTLDTSFGTNGTKTAIIGGSDVLNAIVLQPDRKIVAVGYTGTFSANADFAVARFLGNNTNILTVTNTSDSGAGSLRQAIQTAIATPNLSNQIKFNITAGSAPFTINLVTGLPNITVPILIDGWSQPGWFGEPIIQLNGAGLPAGTGSGLGLAGGGSMVRGLIINRFPEQGIHITVNGGNIIEGCYIGTDATGQIDLGNTKNGIRIESAGNIVGGGIINQPNIISGNDEHGVLITGTAASGNGLYGNTIGLSRNGGVDIGNTFDGVAILSAPNNIIGASGIAVRNTISGNNRFGILIAESTASGNQVKNNQIGIWNGDTDRGNTLSGVRIDKAPNNVIGGNAQEGNVISGNDEHGVLIIFSTATGNTVKGNVIGTNFSNADLGNTFDGVSIQTAASNNIIGGAVAGESNIISGNNRYGVFVGGSNGITIKGNYIGTNFNATSTIGNSGNGIFLNSANSNIIGGINAGEKNTVAFNGDAGISLQDGTGNAFRGNSIFQNASLGIELPAAGVNANDVGDGDTGSNNLQNYPVITRVSSNGNQTTISGTLNSIANSAFNVDFYASGLFFFDSCNAAPPLDYGEGKIYLGSGSTITNTSGNAAFNVTFNERVSAAQRITATATDANGNTSEFSQCFAPTVAGRPRFDFDGDGKADVSVFRPSNGVWYLLQSQLGFTGSAFGTSTDKITPADYDGDGKTDLAVYRGGIWYLNRSQLGFTGVAFGAADDMPAPADFDGDGKAEIGVFRPSNGGWYLYNLANNQISSFAFGQTGDVPVPADYDGDGKADIAVFRPSTGIWYIQRSQTGFTGIGFGQAGDKAVPADYDADGKTDVAVFRQGTWYLLKSQFGFTGITFGQAGDVPVAADYDGDGLADVAVFRNGIWYLQRSQAGFTGIQFGTSGDQPIPSVFVP